MRCHQLLHAGLQLGQGGQGIPQARQVPWAGVAQADPGQDALQIADLLELRLDLLEAVMLQQTGDRVLARFQHLTVTQRAVQPATQQTRTHGGLAAVDHRLQGVVAAAAEVDVQLQVAPGGAVEHHAVVEALMAQAAQVMQGGALGFLGVGQQAARGADGQSQFLAAEAFQVLGRELLAETFEGAVTIEIPGRTPPHATAFFQR